MATELLLPGHTWLEREEEEEGRKRERAGDATGQ